MKNESLSAREEEVIELLAKGIGTRQIAERLWIAVATVRNHIQSIMMKLGVSNRLAAVHTWRAVKVDHAGRVIAYCRRARIPLTDLQVTLIQSTFRAEEVACVGTSHVFPPRGDGEPVGCLCGAISVASGNPHQPTS